MALNIAAAEKILPQKRNGLKYCLPLFLQVKNVRIEE